MPVKRPSPRGSAASEAPSCPFLPLRVDRGCRSQFFVIRIVFVILIIGIKGRVIDAADDKMI